MAGLPEFDSSVGWSFGLRFDGVEIKQITEVSGLKMEQDSIELKANTNDGKYVLKKLPARRKSGTVTLSRPLTDDKGFAKWIESSHFGKMLDARKLGVINVYDFEGQQLVGYNLVNAWPSALEVGTLKAGDTSVLTEKLTIQHEGMYLEGMQPLV